VTESEQVKAALAVLAEGEQGEAPSDGRTETASGEQRDLLGRERGEQVANSVPPSDANGERSDPKAQQPVSDAGREPGDVFEWGPDGTASQAAPERADASADYRAVIKRAQAATEEIEAAAEFVESGGLDRLEEAVTEAEREVSGLAEDGRTALATFERFRVAAAESVEG